MTMIETGGRIIDFREPPRPIEESEDREPPLCKDYCRVREQTERAAAKSAASLTARRIHQELAQMYAAALRRAYEASK